MIRVEAIGPKDAPIALVGEAPGRHEIEQLTPFVGASGNLLNTLMARAGILRNRCYITNVVKERPPNNDISKFIKISGGRVTTTPEYDDYERELKDELERTTSNVIVAVGAVALWALARKTGIMKWRGSVLESTLIPGRKVIPIIHPSAALRQYIFRYYITNDLYRVQKESASPEIRHPRRDLRVLQDIKRAISWIESCNELHEVGFDIETINDELACFSLAKSPTSCCTIPIFSPTKGNIFSEVDETEVLLALSDLLNNKNVTKVGQNIIFDSGFMFRKYGIVTKNMDDTMIAHAILYPDFPKGLDFLTSMYTDEPYYKDEGKMWKKINSDDVTFWIYNAKDSAVTLEVWHKLRAELNERAQTETYNVQKALIEPLLFITHHGIRMDVEGLTNASTETDAKLKELKQKIDEEVGHPIKVQSVNELKNYFYIERKYHPYVNRKTGNITVDRMALKRLAAKGDKVASMILEYRALAKLKSTYFDIKVSKDGRLRAAFNPVGTKSGRLSSSKTFTGEGGNLQNQPPEMKKYMLADVGYLAYNIDLSQAENRIVAYIAPEPRMIRAFEEHIDIHSQTGALIFGGTVESVRAEHDAGQKVPIGDGRHSKRDIGKRANHGLNYGLGHRQFALLLEIPEKDSRNIVESYHRVYPGVRNYHRWVREALSKSRTLTNLLGRKRLFLDRWGEELFKEAYSFIPQSTVADIINRTLVWAYNEFDEIILLNQVHDSIVFELPTSIPITRHIEIVKAITDFMMMPLNAWGRTFRIPAEVEVGLNLKDVTELNLNNEKETTSKLELLYEKAKRLA